ncbi:MAG: hypothetical protein JWL90_1765, partial [Chthoniobacteraceae bacterium]|nr:hypothetical protein [Chthoniobacteraceae bacterium]
MKDWKKIGFTVISLSLAPSSLWAQKEVPLKPFFTEEGKPAAPP